MLYDFSCCIISIDKVDIPYAIMEISEYNSELVKKVFNVAIHSKDKDIEKICDMYGLKFNYDVYCDIFNVTYTLDLDLEDTEEILEEYSDAINEENINISSILEEYESFDFTDL